MPKQKAETIRCRNCRGTGFYRRVICDMCAGEGSINWKEFARVWDGAVCFYREQEQLRRELQKQTRQMKARQAEMDKIVNDYLGRLEPAKGGLHLITTTPRRELRLQAPGGEAA